MLFKHFKQALKDFRFYCLLIALLSMLVLFIHPRAKKIQSVYNFTFIVDITRSMNARDYQHDNEAISRLEFVKQTLRDLLLKLPCQSKVGLGVFTERHSTILFYPIEVCSSYAEIDAAIDAIDWRMAWAADSRISKGITSIIEQLLDKKQTTVIFFTDGQEAPPVNPRYRTDFSEYKNKIKGMLVGVGGLQNVPIPKYNNQGEQIGFYKPEDVPHRSTFGMPPTSSAPIGNFNARNAPFGGAKVVGDQHLTRLYEPYLKELSKDLQWQYHRLETTGNLAQALQKPYFALQKPIMADVRNYPAMFALLMLGLVYFPGLKKPTKRH